MNELFGVSMTTIAIGCIIVTALIFAFVAFIAVRNPVMFKTGLRNIPRRRAQTTLIIVGLMLSTVIITAAFGTGDTMSHSITEEAVTMLGPADEIIQWDTKQNAAPEDKQLIPLSLVDAWGAKFQGDPDIKAFLPYTRELMPVSNTRTRLNEANARITASPAGDLAAFGGLKDIDGKQVVLAADEIAVDEKLADKIDARPGDTLLLFYKGSPVPLKVKAVVPDSLVGGAADAFSRQGAAVNWDFLSSLVGRTGSANFVAVTNDGSLRGGIDRSEAVKAKLTAELQGSPYKAETTKQDNVKEAEQIGNLFTTLFIVVGLFSIAAGVLLIFLIFIMLAAERKPEMGMARAVGAKRRQIVESFLAEGMGYDLGAATVGLLAGIGVAAAMTGFVSYFAGAQIGLDISFFVSLRSLVVSFCLGIVATFIVIFVASWRASRLNIVAAIRDLPESKPLNPEAATWKGYLRGVLNGFAAFGVMLVSVIGALHFRMLLPVFALGALAGVAGPWLGLLRGHNFGAPRAERKAGERIPTWPFVLGLVTAPLGVGVVVLLGYGLALLLVRTTRDRKPSAMSTWVVALGILVAPLGTVLASLQERGRNIAWSVGFGTVGLVTGLLMIQWGMDAQKMFLFAGGCSLVALWVAITLRYFHIHERLAFTLTSSVLLVFWYVLPGGRLDWLTGKLNGDIEMFFLSGATMVTAGTFIVVYNADVVLPLVAALGSRFGRIVPAIKTAIAYPLTARFRTGMTIAMIGLIMFVLSMQSALNTNFTKAFSGDDARGGFDDRLIINGNNRADDLVGAIKKANEDPSLAGKVDTSLIEAAGEVRMAAPSEVQIEDPQATTEDQRYKHFAIMGADPRFIDAQAIPLKFRAAGYPDDASVWAALGRGSALAIIPASLTTGRNGFGPPQGEDLLELAPETTSEAFQPFSLTFRDPGSGATTNVTVIGQSKEAAATFWPAIIVAKGTLIQAFPDSKGQEFFLRLKPGTDSKRYAKQVEAALVQASADSLAQIIDDNTALSRGFLSMFQGFLALGLLVGIAALGVISFRAVVERRQQIGMLRAIGYKRRMVQLSFLLESGFIALSGIGLGLVLGLTFAWNLFTSGAVGDTSAGIPFTIPWLQIGVVTAFAFVASMLMTVIPARSASRVAIAEALRYE